MKIWKCIISLVLLLAMLAGCTVHRPENTVAQVGQLTPEQPFRPSHYRRIARLVQEDGWVYTFIENVPADGDHSDIIRYQFQGMNMRFRYGPDSSAEDPAPMQMWGSANAAQLADRKILNTLLKDPCLTPEELLTLDPEDYTLQTLDKDIFFSLMRQALTEDPVPWGKSAAYRNLINQAFLWEPNYLSGYKFQVAFLHGTGCVDELYIDVLYPTGDGEGDYVQLSVLVEEGKANAQQIALFQELQRIAQTAKAEESYIAGAQSYRDKEFDGVRLSRLYRFLKDIHENNLERYDDGI